MTVGAILLGISVILFLLAAINWPTTLPSPNFLIGLGLFFFALSELVLVLAAK